MSQRYTDKLGITAVCSSDNWAGTEKWISTACNRLASSGHNVKFILRNQTVFKQRLSKEIQKYQLPLKNDADLVSIAKMTSLFRSASDVVIATRVRDYWLAGLAAKLSNTPLLLRLGVVRHLRTSYIMDRLRYAILPDALLVNAFAIRDSLLQTPWMVNKPIHVVYNGVSTPGAISRERKLRAKREMNLPENSICIVGIGRLAVEKRWDWLIDAGSDLIKTGLDLCIRILGEGSERESLQEKIRSNNTPEKIKLVGFQTNTQAWYDAADIVCLPSSNEGTSNTMLEAMGQMVPVVLTSSGGVEEIFKDGESAYIAPTDDFREFRSKLEQACRDEEVRTTIARNAFDTVSIRFSYDRMISEVETILYEMTQHR